MPQRYSVVPQPIDTILTWVKSHEIVIPEIQRPFVWDSSKVRNLLDSLYQGFPVGYLIAWKNPRIRLKDGSLSAGRRILIDGQQRVTALMASLLGMEVITKDYSKVRIRIAFHPLREKFEVLTPIIAKDHSWLPDVSQVFSSDFDLLGVIDSYLEHNPGTNRKALGQVLQRLLQMVSHHVGIIELAEDLDIETVTEVFVRINSAGVPLSQADFVMSKIAADEKYGGALLRKAIDYFCRLSVSPEFLGTLEKNDTVFAASEYMQPMRWLGATNDDLYDPSYSDMLRVAFGSEFGRGRLADLVALLSGRNFESKAYEETIAEASFQKLRQGVLSFINKNNFENFTMILRSAGFISCDLLGGMNAVDFAYMLYLRGRQAKVPQAELERLVRQWYVLSTLTARYNNSPETRFDEDIRSMEREGIAAFIHSVFDSTFPETYWTIRLPQEMETSSTQSPYLLAFQAAQVKLQDKAFLSRDILVRELLTAHGDLHHIFPQNHLKKAGLQRGRYNQIANFVLAQSEVNIAISDKAPTMYFQQLVEQCNGGKLRYGGISTEEEMRKNFRMNCIPESLLNGEVPEYEAFLLERRKLMALKLRSWVMSL